MSGGHNSTPTAATHGHGTSTPQKKQLTLKMRLFFSSLGIILFLLLKWVFPFEIGSSISDFFGQGNPEEMTIVEDLNIGDTLQINIPAKTIVLFTRKDVNHDLAWRYYGNDFALLKPSCSEDPPIKLSVLGTSSTTKKCTENIIENSFKHSCKIIITRTN